MDASSPTEPAAAYSIGDVIHWLTSETRDERFVDNIFAELCIRLQRAGIPLKRASLHLIIQHPQWLGARVLWIDGMREATLTRGATEVREHLDRDPAQGRKHGVYDELRAQGLTDYVAWPMYHTLGKRHAVAFSTDRPGGFTQRHITGLAPLRPFRPAR